jgi:branched-chain amino acid transport system ATP-binding protein
MTLLQVQGLSKQFGGNHAVQNVSFDVGAGELLALIGPNGAGKSTTFNMINGQLPATAGSVKFNGHALLGKSPRQIAHMGIGRTFQIAATFSSFTVRENVQMAFLAHHRRTHVFWRPARNFYQKQADHLLDQVGMLDQADRPCSELAYGDVKRIELAMSLAGDPKLLLMDEPTAGMAPAERNALVGLVKQLVQQRTMAVLFTEHSMDVVFAYADRVIVLARGELIAEGSVQQVRDHPRVQEVYFGTGRSFVTQESP